MGQRRTVIPEAMNDFEEYMDEALGRAREHCALYEADADQLAEIVAVYDAYLAAAAVAYNPATASSEARHERYALQKKLLTLWRAFMMDFIRYNRRVPDADLIVYGVKVKSEAKEKVRTPNVAGAVAIKQLEPLHYQVKVYDQKTRHMKNPANSNGSNIYVAITDLGKSPQSLDEFTKYSFAEDNRHEITFMPVQTGKQANIYACYTNAHDKVGPKGPVSWVVIR
jgi:hypothetical protein